MDDDNVTMVAPDGGNEMSEDMADKILSVTEALNAATDSYAQAADKDPLVRAFLIEANAARMKYIRALADREEASIRRRLEGSE